MGTVIYSASPLQAMFTALLTVVILLVFGVMSLGLSIVRKNQGRGARIVMALAGIFLLAVGCIVGGINALSLSRGAQTVTVMLNDKTIAEDNCGDNGQTCTRYVLETMTADYVTYDFNVPRSAYEAAQVNTCYQFSYMASQSPFVVAGDSDMYHSVNAVTRIEVVDPSACR